MDEGSDARRAEMLGFKTRLFERMRGMHRAWIEKAREIRDLELDYGSRLMTAKSPAQAASLCNEWMAKRMAIVAHEQEIFANSWLWLLADMANPPTPIAPMVSTRGQQQQGPACPLPPPLRG
jgi:hypothetical protein